MERDVMRGRFTQLRAQQLYDEMRQEGLSLQDLPRKLRERNERELAIAMRFAETYSVNAKNAYMLVQIAMGNEQVAEQGCRAMASSGSLLYGVAVITMLTGEDYETTGYPSQLR